jgi:hypothetical protein
MSAKEQRDDYARMVLFLYGKTPFERLTSPESEADLRAWHRLCHLPERRK